MHNKPYKFKVITPGIRLSIAVGLFIIFSSIYVFFYLFWSDLAFWGNENDLEFSYIRYVWAFILCISVIIPFILTTTRIKTKFWIIAWITGLLLSFVTWFIWYYLI